MIITSPDGRKAILNAPDDAPREAIIKKVGEAKGRLFAPAETVSTAPESNPDIAGPMRPTYAALEAQGAFDPSPGPDGQSYIKRSQQELARGQIGAMAPEEAAKVRRTLAENAARSEGQASPMLYGASGVLAPHLIDKGMGLADAGIYALSGGRAGQPYEESVETNRIKRDKNWQENPSETFAGGLVAAGSLPVAAPFNAATKAGWTGNAALNAAGYGALHGAGSGSGVAEGTAGALSEGVISALGGALLGRLTARLRPQSAPERQAITAAQRAGVRIPEAVATDSTRIQQEAGLLSKMPVSGGKLQARLNESIDDVAGGIEQSAARYAGRRGGAVPDDAEVGERGIGAIRQWMQRTSADELTASEAEIARDLLPGTLTEPRNVARMAQQLLIEDHTRASRVNAPAINAVMEAIERPGGLTFEGLRGLRTALDAQMQFNVVNEAGTAAPAFQRIRSALTQDIRNHVQSYGRRGPQSVAMFDQAMLREAQVLRQRARLEKIIGKKGDLNPEALVDKVGQWASTRGGRSVSRLAELARVVPPQVMDDIAAVTLTRWARQSGKVGEFSLGNFDKMWKGMSPEGKRLLFGGGGRTTSRHADTVARLDALSETIDNLQKVLGEINYSRTSYGNQLMRKLEAFANFFGSSAKGVMALGAGSGAAAAGYMVAGATGAGAALLPFVVGRYIANQFAKPATIRNLNNLLQTATTISRAGSPSPKLQQVINASHLAIAEMAGLIANSDEAKEAGITKEQLQPYLLQELGPQQDGR
jgi:hypothetical protein